MWRVFKEAGRPWPTLTDDDVTDYMVMEAVAIKAQHEQAEAQRKAERKQLQLEKAQALAREMS